MLVFRVKHIGPGIQCADKEAREGRWLLAFVQGFILFGVLRKTEQCEIQCPPFF